MAGDTDKLALAELNCPPTGIVYALSVYHCQYALVPKLPPVCVRVVLLPLQIGVVALKVVGATDDWLTVTVTPPDGPATVPAQGLEVPSALK